MPQILQFKTNLLHQNLLSHGATIIQFLKHGQPLYSEQNGWSYVLKCSPINVQVYATARSIVY